MSILSSLKSLVVVGLMASTIGIALTPPAHAERYYRGSSRYYRHNGTYFQRHPYQKTGLVGAGIGAAGGALLAPHHDRGNGIIKGAAIGGAAGLGYQYLKRR